MRATYQDKNPIFQLYRKDEMARLKKKIRQIKTRKPEYCKSSSTVTLPKLNYNKSLSPIQANRIKVENERLNKSIVKKMETSRKSGLNLINSSEIDKIYQSSFGPLKVRTNRAEST